MLVSVHMPKTAGLSFRVALEEHFGQQFRHDYQDYPLARTSGERRAQALTRGKAARAEAFTGVECIHGHFLAVKYLPLADRLPCTFVTWLREPVARLVSHYYYWIRAYDPDSGSTSALHRQVVEEGWSLERFCLAPQLRDVYTEFLWRFPLERLDFIGITEFFADDLRYFSHEILGNNLRALTLNRRPEDAGTTPQVASEGLDRPRIEAYHARDVALYRKALALRARRIGRET